MIGDRIEHLRKDYGMTQDELAEKLGVTKRDVSLWENGQIQPSLDNIILMSNIFDTPTDVLLDNTKFESLPKEIKDGAVVSLNSDEARKRRRNYVLIVLAIIFVVLIAIFCVFYQFVFKSFSSSPSAINNAQQSVVKLICYDHNGEETAIGSGFFIYDDKTIVTNYHVISEAYACDISTEQDKTYSVSKVVGYDKDKDIAIITLSENTGLKPLKIGDPNKVKKGEKIVAIGSPLGIKNSVSDGILSGRITMDDMSVLQFTAPISSGNSGGALFDDKGRVIGVTFASYEDGQNLNLAIPIDLVENIYRNLKYEMSISTIYMEEHQYARYERKYYDAINVNFDDLKSRSDSYNDKMVKLHAYVSSVEYKKSKKGIQSIVLYYSMKENVSGNINFDESLRLSSGINIAYSNVPVMYFFTVDIGTRDYIEKDLKVGDSIVIIGKFSYFRVGDINESGHKSNTEHGEINANVIYKEQ